MNYQLVAPHDATVHEQFHAANGRPDGRSFTAFRELSSVSHQEYLLSTEMVRLGSTLVLVALRTEILVSTEGSVPALWSVDVSSAFAQTAEYGRLQHGLADFTSLLVDPAALCVVAGLAYWQLAFNIAVVHDDGNLLDACLHGMSRILAAHRFPELAYDEAAQALTATQLHADRAIGLRHGALQACSLKVLRSGVLVDPSAAETALPGSTVSCILSGGDILFLRSDFGEFEPARICELTRAHGIPLL